jgi:FkbM family methyltransferase
MTTTDPLSSLLRPERLTAVVDIGANPIDGIPPYAPLLAKGLCTVLGFEPQPQALAALNARKSALETYLPYAIGDGRPGTLRVCRAAGMTSLLRPNRHLLAHFKGFEHLGKVVDEVPVETRRLDDVEEILHLDFLKIDVQGAELMVFNNGNRRLAGAVAIQTEVSFLALYESQPVFGEIDIVLRSLGFVPHDFAEIKKWMISPLYVEGNPYAAINQLLEADVVYVRDFTRADEMEAEQLKHLAIIAHHCYRSFDLAANCIHHLVARRAIPQDSVPRYLALLTTHAN